MKIERWLNDREKKQDEGKQGSSHSVAASVMHRCWMLCNKRKFTMRCKKNTIFPSHCIATNQSDKITRDCRCRGTRDRNESLHTFFPYIIFVKKYRLNIEIEITIIFSLFYIYILIINTFVKSKKKNNVNSERNKYI